MKSLRESLFDKDLIEKNINFFDLYNWYYGDASVVLPNGNEVPLQVALENEIKFDQLFKKDKLNKLPHPKELIESSSDGYIFRNIYNALSTSSIEKFSERWTLAKTISNSIREVIKVKTMGGGIRCDIYPMSVKHKNLLDDNIKSIMIIDEFNFQIGKSLDDTYRLKVIVSLKRKH